MKRIILTSTLALLAAPAMADMHAGIAGYALSADGASLMVMASIASPTDLQTVSLSMPVRAIAWWNAPTEVVHQLGYNYPVLGGLNDGWKTRKAGRYRAEASAS